MRFVVHQNCLLKKHCTAAGEGCTRSTNLTAADQWRGFCVLLPPFQLIYSGDNTPSTFSDSKESLDLNHQANQRGKEVQTPSLGRNIGILECCNNWW